MKFRKNLPIILGLSIPIAMILVVVATIYVPPLFVKPQTNFIYSVGGMYYSDSHFVVKDAHLTKPCAELPSLDTTNGAPIPGVDMSTVQCAASNYGSLYVYNVKDRISEPITFEEAQKLTLNNQTLSPDGFEVVDGARNSDFSMLLLSNSNYNTWYMHKGSFSQKINVSKASDSDYNYNFRFLGWIE